MKIEPLTIYVLTIIGPSLCFLAGALLALIVAFSLETFYAPRKLRFIDEMEGRIALCASGAFSGWLITFLFIGDDYAMSVFGLLWLIASFILAFSLAEQFASAKRRRQSGDASKPYRDSYPDFSTTELVMLANRKTV